MQSLRKCGGAWPRSKASSSESRPNSERSSLAQKSAGANCPVCGTLTACIGSFEDELLVGQCSLGHTVSVVNHRIERTDAGPAWVKVVGTPVDVPEPAAVARAAAPVPLAELPKDHPGSVTPNPAP